jgi:hypothetical protein
MSLNNQNGVAETSTTTGTGAYTLAGAVAGFQSFAAVGNGNTCHYVAYEVDANGNRSGGREEGLGTYTSAGTTLARTTIYSSSNGGAAENWGAGTRVVACSPLAEGTLVVRQPGGTAGTDEGRSEHDGKQWIFHNPDTGHSSTEGAYRFNIEAGATHHRVFVTDGTTTYFSVGRLNGVGVFRSDIVAQLGQVLQVGPNDGILSIGRNYSYSFQLRDDVWQTPVCIIKNGDGSAPGWIQNSAGVKFKVADQTNDSATLADDTHLTFNVLAGRKYIFIAELAVATGAAAEGIKVALTGTATITNLIADVEIKSHAATPIFTLGRITAFDTAIGQTIADAGNGTVEVVGTFECNAAGTFKLSWAKNVDLGAANTTLKRGSWMMMNDAP